MTGLGDYHNFYLLTNALLLAEVFENFRDVCLQRYGLDAVHNYASPCLSWQAALKMKDVELDLLTDIDQHLFIEEGIREGVAMISHWYARANAPGMENDDSSERSNYTMYQDTNNLYGRAMSQLLPKCNFKWLTDKEMEELDVMMAPDDSPRGYIWERDFGKYLYVHVYFIKCNVSFLHVSDYPRDFTSNVSLLCISEYPHELHDLHKDCPLAPERLQIEENLLSDYQVARWRIQQTSTQTRPEFTQRNELHHSLPQFKVVLGIGVTSHQCLSCFVVRSIAMVKKLHQL